MAKNKHETADDPKLREEQGVSRRDFVTGAAAGVGTAALLGGGEAEAQRAQRWDYEFDVVVAAQRLVRLARRRRPTAKAGHER